MKMYYTGKYPSDHDYPLHTPMIVACVINSFSFPRLLSVSPRPFRPVVKSLLGTAHTWAQWSEENMTLGALRWSLPNQGSVTSSGKWGNWPGQSQRSLSTSKGEAKEKGRKQRFEFLLCDSYWADNTYGYYLMILITTLGDVTGERMVTQWGLAI